MRSSDGVIARQVWFDDADSLGWKFRMCRDIHNIGGVGLYQATGGYPDSEQCDDCMAPVYNSINTNFVQNAPASAP